MKKEQVAAQMYTVRDALKTTAEIASSLKRVRQIGYETVELAGLGPIPDSELKAMLDGEGLQCCSSHEPPDVLLEEPQKVIDRLGALACPVAVYPYPAKVSLDTNKEVESFIGRLAKAGQTLAAAGITLAYHNHNIEFRRVDGKLILDLIYDGTDPRAVMAEIDVYWVQAGGNDPAAWCRKMKGRLPILHLKDYGVEDHFEGTPKGVFREVGRGNLDWPAIIEAAEGAGCKTFVVEQDGNWIDGDPFAALAVSYEYVVGTLCR